MCAAMNTSHGISPASVAESLPGRPPTEFAGMLDEGVMRDLHRLVPRSAMLGLSILRYTGIGMIVAGTPMAILSHGYPELLYPAVACFAMGLNVLAGWLIGRKGRVRFARDQVVTGRIYGAGIIVDQLAGRTDWNQFQRAHLSSSAALLYVNVKQLFGLPLHRSFFESAEAWEEVSQLIREQVRSVSLVADV